MDEDASSSAERHLRVKFSETEDTFRHDCEIGVQKIKEGFYSIHLGFLQIGHRYEIKFQFNCNTLFCPLMVRDSDNASLYTRVIDLSPVASEPSLPDRGYLLTLELFANKEKLIREKLELVSCNNPTLHISFLLNARVLGKGKGTPLLKNGIRCIGVEMEEDSELSDWQGFE